MKYLAQALAIAVSALNGLVWADGSACPAPESDSYYFRSGSFGTSDDFVRNWYSSHLRAMGEPSMWCGSPAESEYRFTWLRTFHRPIAVHITSAGNAARLEAVELDGAGGYEPGSEVMRVSRPLSIEDWKGIQQAMEAWEPTVRSKLIGVDGAQWIFERRTPTGYSVISVWSPVSGPARELGQLFISKAGIVVPAKENY